MLGSEIGIRFGTVSFMNATASTTATKSGRDKVLNNFAKRRRFKEVV
jgi:hypothetical protein